MYKYIIYINIYTYIIYKYYMYIYIYIYILAEINLERIEDNDNFPWLQKDFLTNIETK